ncbi:MAG: hypoxanthine phosphoribosyltransferase [Acidobacteriota bacterium]
MKNPQTSVLISEARIQARIRELGAAITRDYPDGELILLGILKGSCLFLADLVRAIDRPVKIDFMGMASYGSGTVSSGEVAVTKKLGMNITGAHLLIVEDIVDTGRTLHALVHLLQQEKPQSVQIAALLDKEERREFAVPVAYRGFPILNEFVVGYGLDFNEEYRGLKDICILREGA